MCVYVGLGVCMCSKCVQVLLEARRGGQILWSCSHRSTNHLMWVLGIEPRYSERTVSTLSLWAISPAMLAGDQLETIIKERFRGLLNSYKCNQTSKLHFDFSDIFLCLAELCFNFYYFWVYGVCCSTFQRSENNFWESALLPPWGQGIKLMLSYLCDKHFDLLDHLTITGWTFGI